MVDIRPGQRITAGLLQSLTPQAPVVWTPVWTTSTGAATPSFGNSDIVAEYQQFGRLCVGRLDVNFGSTVDFGTSPTTSDNWRFSTPVSALSTYADVGSGELWQDSSGTTAGRCRVRVRLTSVDTFELEISSGRVDATNITNRGLTDSVSPWTWAAGDNFSFTFAYPTAA